MVFLLPLVLQLCMVAGWQSVSAWQLSPARYFLPLGRRSYLETTTLLVYNHTGEGRELLLILPRSGILLLHRAEQMGEMERIQGGLKAFI